MGEKNEVKIYGSCQEELRKTMKKPQSKLSDCHRGLNPVPDKQHPHVLPLQIRRWLNYKGMFATFQFPYSCHIHSIDIAGKSIDI
jgi:hypothetical protein